VTHTYQYDAAGRLVLATDTSGSMNYAYDALGRRISRTTSGGSGLPPVTTEFVYDGDACVQEWSDDGTGTGTIDAAVTFANGDRTMYGITTRDGTVSYPVPSAAAAINSRNCTCLSGYHVVNNAARTGPRVCTCPPGYYLSAARNKVEHWGDPHENLNGLCLVTSATGAVTERFDCDDAGKPVFLAADGLPTGSSSAIGPIRWMAPEAMWEPSIGMLLGADAVYCPDLGMTVARVQDHNSSRSNKSSN
jgi:YD repeat-containing protein